MIVDCIRSIKYIEKHLQSKQSIEISRLKKNISNLYILYIEQLRKPLLQPRPYIFIILLTLLAIYFTHKYSYTISPAHCLRDEVIPTIHPPPFFPADISTNSLLFSYPFAIKTVLLSWLYYFGLINDIITQI